MKDNQYILLPNPKKITYEDGLKSITDADRESILQYKKGFPVPDCLSVAIKPEDMVHIQGYTLSISGSDINIIAADDAALFYAIMTLRQIFWQAENNDVRCLTIEDWPEYPIRGVMLDISRDRVPTMETLHLMIEMFAELKMNHLQLYTEHTFAYKDHEKVWKDASPITAEEIQEINALCESLYIDLVPNQNSFGHMERWLIHPEYKDMAETTDGFIDFYGNYIYKPFTLCPIEARTLGFLQGLYDELLPNFTSPYFNIGGDETYDLGQGKSKHICEEQGKGKVYLDFIAKLNEEVKKRGKKMLFWGDIILRHPELISSVPSDCIALNWGYEDIHPFGDECSKFKESGIEFYVCSGTSSWNSVGGRWQNARDNIDNACENGLKNGATGYIVTDWGDNGHMQQYCVSFLPYVYAAGVSWGYEDNKEADVKTALSVHFLGDKSGKTAEALERLGNVYLMTADNFHNSTLFGVLLFDHVCQYYAESLELLKPGVFDSARQEIMKVKELINESTMTIANTKKFEDEINFTADLMLFAADLGDAREAAENMEIKNIPLDVRNGLNEKLAALIERYKKLWLVRSRPGGLADSAGMLESLSEMLAGNNE